MDFCRGDCGGIRKGMHAQKEKNRQVALKKGLHKLAIDFVEGGGKGRRVVTIVNESNNHVFTFPNNGNIGGRLGTSRLIQGVSPFAIASLSNCVH